MVIHVNIVDKRAAVAGAPVIVCGNSGYTVKFTFDDEWSGFGAKTARFVYVQAGAVRYQDVVFTGSTADVPVLANTKEVRIGVFAGDLRTTTPAVVPCELSIRCGTGAPADPTPSQYDQIMELLATGGSTVTADSITEALGYSPADAVAIGDLHERVSDVAMQIDTKQPYGDYALKSDVSTHNTSNASHNDIRLLISGLTSRLDALANSDDTTLDQLSEIVAYIKANKSLIDGITTSKVNVADIVNNLTSNVTNKPLSAAQGVALKKLIDAIKIPTTLPASDVYSWAKQPNKPTYTASEVGAASAAAVDQLSATVTNQQTTLANSVLFTAQTLTESQKAQARANIGASAGEDIEPADSVEWLNENGDTSKKYVLPDGYIYAWMYKSEVVEHNANDGTGDCNKIPSGSGNIRDNLAYKSGVWTTPIIPIDPTVCAKDAGNRAESAITISGLPQLAPACNWGCIILIWWYKEDGTVLLSKGQADLSSLKVNGETVPDNTNMALPVTFQLCDSTLFIASNWNTVRYVRLALGISTSGDIVESDIENLKVNMPFLNSEVSGYGWYSTGQQHSNDKATQQNSADIAELKERVEELENSGIDSTVSIEQCDFIEYDSGNLFNKAEAVTGYYLSGNGNLSADAASAATGFIPVDPSTTYVRSSGANVYPIHEYDGTQKWLRTISENPFTTSADCHFVRTTIAVSQTPIDTYMVCKGASLPSGYLPYGVSLRIAGQTVLLDTNGATMPLFNKLGCIGDSLTNQEKWQTTACAVANITEWHKNAITGSSVAYYEGETLTPFVDRYLSTPEDCDCIVIMGGTNDRTKAASNMGEVGVCNRTTFKGAYSTIIEGLLARNSATRIMLLSPPRCYTAGNVNDTNILPVVEAVKEIAEHYGLPFLDLYHNLGINDKTYSYMLYDNVHFSNAGGLRLGRMIGNFIKNNY